MLLEFKTKNYKSFCDEMIFSMTPAPKQKGLDFSILKQRIGSVIIKGLSSAVIYGPNASGKTNIIGAMDVFKSIVLRGNIRNDADRKTPNAAASALELIPNSDCAEPTPTEFSITFIERGMLVKYGFTVDFGKFLDVDYQRQVLSETLWINNNLIFSRTDDIIFEDFKVIKPFLVNEFSQNKNSIITIAKNNLVADELFLTNGFKAMFSSKLVSLITNWLDSRFMVIYRADSLNLIHKFTDPKKKSVYVEKTTNDAAKLFGVNSNALGYMIPEDDSDAKLCSLFKGTGVNVAMAADLFESYGTIRFVNMFPLVIKAILNGGTLVVDEFDASIHPMALMSIINIFHNNEINKNNAQLIFNTHNPIFLNSNLFRRDEIKFVERDDKTHCSSHYSLSDFGTIGKNGARKHEDYMSKYFISQYGAIKDIDFTPVFDSLLEHQIEVQ